MINQVQRPAMLEAVTLDLYLLRLVFTIGSTVEP